MWLDPPPAITPSAIPNMLTRPSCPPQDHVSQGVFVAVLLMGGRVFWLPAEVLRRVRGQLWPSSACQKDSLFRHQLLQIFWLFSKPCWILRCAIEDGCCLEGLE